MIRAEEIRTALKEAFFALNLKLPIRVERPDQSAPEERANPMWNATLWIEPPRHQGDSSHPNQEGSKGAVEHRVPHITVDQETVDAVDHGRELGALGD